MPLLLTSGEEYDDDKSKAGPVQPCRHLGGNLIDKAAQEEDGQDEGQNPDDAKHFSCPALSEQRSHLTDRDTEGLSTLVELAYARAGLP